MNPSKLLDDRPECFLILQAAVVGILIFTSDTPVETSILLSLSGWPSFTSNDAAPPLILNDRILNFDRSKSRLVAPAFTSMSHSGFTFNFMVAAFDFLLPPQLKLEWPLL